MLGVNDNSKMITLISKRQTDYKQSYTRHVIEARLILYRHVIEARLTLGINFYRG